MTETAILAGPERRRLDSTALFGVAPEQHGAIRFLPHPALSLLSLNHPTEAIWRAALIEEEAERATALDAINLAQADAIVAVSRGAQGLSILPLLPAQRAFLAAMMTGARLADALDSAPDSEAAIWLGGFFAAGYFTGYRF